MHALLIGKRNHKDEDTMWTLFNPCTSKYTVQYLSLQALGSL